MNFQDISIPLSMIGSYLGESKRILSVSLLITPRCNYRCLYCDSPYQKDKEMTTDQMKSMIDEFAEMGVKRLGFTGGEPLLRTDTPELISHAKQHGIKTTLFSNGTLIPHYIKQLKDLDLLLMSFDGPQEVQDSQRMKGSFNHVEKAVAAAKEHGLKVWTNTVMTKNNIQHIDYILEKGNEWGVSSMFMPIFEYSITPCTEDIAKLRADLPLFRKGINRIKEAKREGYPIINSQSYFQYLLDHWPNQYLAIISSAKYFRHLLEHGPKKEVSRCYASKFYCAVNSDGMVAPCHYLMKTKKWPNGLELGFKKAVEQSTIETCPGCYGNNYVDMNLLFSGSVESMANALKMYRF